MIVVVSPPAGGFYPLAGGLPAAKEDSVAEKLIEVEAIHPFTVGNVSAEQGKVVKLPEDVAARVIADGSAKRCEPPKKEEEPRKEKKSK